MTLSREIHLRRRKVKIKSNSHIKLIKINDGQSNNESGILHQTQVSTFATPRHDNIGEELTKNSLAMVLINIVLTWSYSPP